MSAFSAYTMQFIRLIDCLIDFTPVKNAETDRQREQDRQVRAL